ncbi:MAG: DUF2797 domain-containing protein [Bacteroidales bacterium]|nr:DUF2797 domain-containing protein [Bacteroidales bacterium]
MKTLFTGSLSKMQFTNAGSELEIKPEYFIQSDSGKLHMNNLIGKEITIRYDGKINCMSCGKLTKKSYGQGYCYPCFISIPHTEECVIRPELCRAHEGIARDMEYAKKHCLTDQYIYLALSGGLKVGVTRYHQIPTRWVDQGANFAIKLAIAKNRHTAGVIEVSLKQIFADKTNWRKMLTGNDNEIPLMEQKAKAIEHIKDRDIEFTEAENVIYTISYPVEQFPTKVTSVNFDKKPEYNGVLTGIKGQYLMFDGNTVLNIRRHGGYNIEMLVGE